MADEERLRRLPAWAWLVAVVVASAAIRLWLVRDMSAPFIFVDELFYSELAKSLAAGDGYAVREVSTSGYSLLYPALIAPAYWLFDAVPDAYAVVKAIGAVTMSFAAVPAYFVARRVVRTPLALLAAVLTVVVPSMAYTATVTTESLFYPVALATAWLLLRYLERPSWGRMLVLLAVVGVAFATRAQALAFLPAIASAPVVLAVLRGRATGLRPFVPLYALLAGATVLVVGVQAARGRSPSDLLGAYSIVGEGGYDLGSVLRFWLWHLEELDLYICVLPVAALVLLLAIGRGLPPRLQEHLAATTALIAWSSLAVAMFASRFASDRIQDRYLFFLVPLLLVALLAWVELGAPRPVVPTTVAVAIALGLPLLIPYTRFIGEPAKSDTLGLLPLWTVNEHLVLGDYWTTAAAVGIALVVLFLLVPMKYAVAVPLVVLGLLVVFSKPVWSGPHGFLQSGAGALFQGIRGVERDWIDQAVPAGEDVAALWTGHADRFTINQNEFFNRRVGRIYYVNQPTPGGVGETKVTLGPDGVFRDPAGRPITARYALLDGTVTPAGVVVARDDQLGTTLWRLDGPLRSTTTVTGLYPDDTWSGRTVTWTRVRCAPGKLSVALRSDPSLFTSPQTVTGRTDGVVESVQFAQADTATLTIPVVPAADGTCAVRFVVSPTAVPARQIPGSKDARVLGAHFDSFVYSPGA